MDKTICVGFSKGLVERTFRKNKKVAWERDGRPGWAVGSIWEFPDRGWLKIEVVVGSRSRSRLWMCVCVCVNVDVEAVRSDPVVLCVSLLSRFMVGLGLCVALSVSPSVCLFCPLCLAFVLYKP